MRKNIAVRVAALLLLSTLPNGFTFSQEDPSEDLVLSVLGTWTTGRITVDGTKVTHTLELKKSSDGKNYEHDWTITGADESKTSHWEAKLEIAPLGKKMVSLSYIENRRLAPADKVHDWRPFELVLVVQPDQNQLFAINALDNETWIWRRADVDSHVAKDHRLDVLAPLLETYSGTHDHLGSEAYGVVNNKKQITSSGKLTPTGTVLEHRWVSIPEGAGPEKAFEARGVYSYSVKEKTIIKQYQSSTGVHMTGRLVAVQDKKMLWERTGEGPTGTIRELCQFDFTDPNVFKHLIIHRSLNGVPTDEGGQLITLSKQ